MRISTPWGQSSGGTLLAGAVTSLIHPFTGTNEITNDGQVRECVPRASRARHSSALPGAGQRRALVWGGSCHAGGACPGAEAPSTSPKTWPWPLGLCSLRSSGVCCLPSCWLHSTLHKTLGSSSSTAGFTRGATRGGHAFCPDAYSPSEKTVTQPHGACVLMAPAAASTGA